MDEVEAEDMYEASVYSLKHCISHLCDGGCRKDARALMFRSEYLEQRARLGPAHALVLDGNRVLKEKDKPLELLHSAIKLSQPVLQRDPSQLGVQVAGRLLAHLHHPDIKDFVESIEWLPTFPSMEQAGGACLGTFAATVVG